MTALGFRDRSRLPAFHWAAVGAGLFVALGIHIVATAFGLGVAFSSTTVMEEGGAGIGLLLWSGLAWILGAFVGGYVTAWVADSTRYLEGLFHGIVLWGVLTFVLMFLPPSTMGVGSTLSDTTLSPAIISSVAWFIAIGGLLSLGTTVWGAVIGSRVVEQVETKSGESYRAA